MKCRLMLIDNWPELAHKVRYQVVELAAICMISVRELERFTIWRFGATPCEMLTHFRMVRALLLLRDTRLSVKEVAREIFYEEASCFSREFKRFHGISPSGVRNGSVSAASRIRVQNNNNCFGTVASSPLRAVEGRMLPRQTAELTRCPMADGANQRATENMRGLAQSVAAPRFLKQSGTNRPNRPMSPKCRL